MRVNHSKVSGLDTRWAADPKPFTDSDELPHLMLAFCDWSETWGSFRNLEKNISALVPGCSIQPLTAPLHIKISFVIYLFAIVYASLSEVGVSEKNYKVNYLFVTLKSLLLLLETVTAYTRVHLWILPRMYSESTTAWHRTINLWALPFG